MKEEKKFSKPKIKAENLAGFEAKKDHIICHNDFKVDIKKGDDLEKIPILFKQTLETEGVI